MNPSPDERRWVSVGDRMPVDGVPVLIYCGICLLGEWYSFIGNWQADGRRLAPEDVTHWMPLPSPPEKP